MSHVEPEHNRPPEGSAPEEPFPMISEVKRRWILRITLVPTVASSSRAPAKGSTFAQFQTRSPSQEGREHSGVNLQPRDYQDEARNRDFADMGRKAVV
jgi:hypothetical protein